MNYIGLDAHSKSCTFEESNLSHWLHGLFEGEVDEQVVCNPLYV